MTKQPRSCIYCERTTQDVPLLTFDYRGVKYNICPGHLPILIHQLAKLADKLPGTEGWPASSGH